MPKQPLRLALLLPMVLAFTAAMAAAQTFDVTLGNRPLGNLTFSAKQNGATLRTTLDNTPLGVFNGTFVATSRRFRTDRGTTALQYVSESASSRKTRTISVLTERNQVVETAVTPQSERTAMSDPARVHGRVIDPVTAFGQMFSASGCPASTRIYDGRRVVALQVTGSTTEANSLTCELSYTVVAGPGHLSPLYISNVSVFLKYDTAGEGQKLSNMQFSSGPFSLSIKRRK